jgi:hypothetical protein
LRLRIALASLQKKLLALVDQTSASWNLLTSWLETIDALRRAA